MEANTIPLTTEERFSVFWFITGTLRVRWFKKPDDIFQNVTVNKYQQRQILDLFQEELSRQVQCWIPGQVAGQMLMTIILSNVWVNQSLDYEISLFEKKIIWTEYA